MQFFRRDSARGGGLHGAPGGTHTTVATAIGGFNLKSEVGAPIEAAYAGIRMTPDRSRASDDDRRVVPFRPRHASARGGGWRWPLRSPRPSAPPVEGLAKYEGGEPDDDYRHRMAVNLAALVVTVLLMLAGIWLVMQLAELRKNQDCVLTGRRNCAPIEVNAPER
jgi:hypothetical protein